MCANSANPANAAVPSAFATLLLTLHPDLLCIRSPIAAPGAFMPVVELAGVTKAYESKVAVRDLSLSIEAGQMFGLLGPDRKSTRLNSSHLGISYAVFCL